MLVVFIGYSDGDSTRVINCINEGNIIGIESSVAYVGGIIGHDTSYAYLLKIALIKVILLLQTM